MGVDTKRPPLPAPTDVSSADNASVLPDDLATDVSRVTEKTSYSIPEDGSPVTITTKKRDGNDLRPAQSQTSLLIEYFEGGKNGDKPHSRPSVRVRVTPSSRRSKSSADHIQITESKNRKPSYTRRISLGAARPREEKLPQPTELSYSEPSNLSSDRPPVEVEVLQNLSDLSRSDVSQDRRVLTTSTDISSMPPDSMLDGEPVIRSPPRHRSEVEQEDEIDYLKAPSRRRSRSLSRERITQKATQKVMEKLKEKPGESGSRSKSSASGRISRDESLLDEKRSSRRKSGRTLKEDDFVSGTESSLLSSNVHRRSGDSHSIRSGSAISAASSINNPKLLQTVEDAIRRLILPELTALKEEQKTQKNREKFERGTTRDSIASSSSRDDLRRRVSKTSSAPDILKPKVTLSRHGEDKEVTISGDSIKSRSSRRSSRDSVDTYREEEKQHRKSSKEKRHKTRDGLAAGVAAGALTAAALKHHDSQSSVSKERRKRRSSRSKSRSRTASISESIEESYRKEDIPPLPMRSEINASELTRESILTAESERDRERRDSLSSRGNETPVREVARSSPRQVQSPSLRTPPRTPSALRQGLNTEHNNRSIGDISLQSAKSDRSLHSKATTAAGLAAAAAAAAHYGGHHEDYDDDDYEEVEEHTIQRPPYSPGRPLSPIQSVASYREEDDIHHGARSVQSTSSLGSAAREPRRRNSNMSIDSLVSSPSTKVARTRKRPTGVNLERREDVIGQHEPLPGRETPLKKEADSFFQHNHEENERYRRELEDGSPVSSPTKSKKHMSGLTDESTDSPFLAQAQDLRGRGRAEYVNTPLAVESAVASLHDPSTVSSSQNSQLRESNYQENYSEVSSLNEQLAKDPPAVAIAKNQSRSIQDMSPTKERWHKIKEQAQLLSEKHQQERVTTQISPQKTPARSFEEIKMGASAIPTADDPMPEIGYHDDAQSDVTTNPSEIKGPLGGYDYGDRSHWPNDPTPDMNETLRSPGPDHDHFTGKTATGLTAAGLAAAAANRIRREHEDASPRKQASIDDEYRADPEEIYGVQGAYGRRESVPESPGLYNPDEGYISTAQPGDITPEPYHDGQDRYNAGYDTNADPFATPAAKHARHVSGLSHGMDSPLYDGATGNGLDAIQSKDIVALMDHLTVRDAQRNARDTEILVTLVRSAAEMRTQFEEMKRFITEQDALIMQNTAAQSNILGQKILQGPRPQPLGSPRTPRTARGSSTDDATEDLPAKRRNVFRRALKGLSMKSTNDLAKIEEMLMQLLNEVEGLKEGQTLQRVAAGLQANAQSLNSYENLRASGDPGYEPEGQAGTSSTPNHSGYLSNPSSSRPGMHSGYQAHRISAVPEDDEESEQEAERHEEDYPNEERLLTPTQEVQRAQAAAALERTPPQPSKQYRNSQDDDTPKRKHKSNSSSIFGIPKISRWSKTTASTRTPDNVRKSKDRPYSVASRSGSDVNVVVYDDEYTLHTDDRIRSTTSLPGRQYEQRPPSPLIPEDDGPKYQAHRNSLNLQHPQPRPGPTHRHQTHLESEAINFNDVQMMTPTSETYYPETKSDLDAKHDQWGSNPSLILNRNQAYDRNNLSPIGSDRPYSAHSASDQVSRQPKGKDEAPLIPPKVAVDPESPYADVPGAGYVSPHSYSSGHLAPLAPIEEVRYSLETDGGRGYTPSPQPSSGMRTPQRKITGPRPMASRSPSTQSPRQANTGKNDLMGNTGTVVRRKPVSAMDQQERDREFEELESYRSSVVSETF